MIDITGSKLAPSYYIIATSLLSLASAARDPATLPPLGETSVPATPRELVERFYHQSCGTSADEAEARKILKRRLSLSRLARAGAARAGRLYRLPALGARGAGTFHLHHRGIDRDRRPRRGADELSRPPPRQNVRRRTDRPRHPLERRGVLQDDGERSPSFGCWATSRRCAASSRRSRRPSCFPCKVCLRSTSGKDKPAAGGAKKTGMKRP